MLKILDERVRKESGKIIVTKSTEEEMTIEQIQMQRQKIGNQKIAVLQQIQRLKIQYDELCALDSKLDGFMQELQSEIVDKVGE